MLYFLDMGFLSRKKCPDFEVFLFHLKKRTTPAENTPPNSGFE